MRTVGLDYQQRQLVMKEVPEPELRTATQVLLRVHEVGVCGTDRELANFRLGFPPPESDFLVIGRAITGSRDPAATARTILASVR